MRLTKSFTCYFFVLVLLGVSALAESATYISASSVYEGDFSPIYLLDGNKQTRWASKTNAPGEWVQVDFGKIMSVGDFSIIWERAYAREYEVLLSDDGDVWHTVHHCTDGSGDSNSIRLPEDATGRFFRIKCNIPSEFALYSIWEIVFHKEEIRAAIERQQKACEREERERNREAQEELHAAMKKSGVSEIVFVRRGMYEDGHWYANISYFAQDENHKTYVRGSGMYVYDVMNDTVRPLLEDETGTLRDPAVHYDGETILFSWRRGDSETFHLYTIKRDGTELTQLTFGEYDDIEPAWLPDGGIVFVSSRCRRWVNCWLTQVAVNHRCDADGRNVVPLSANIEHDNTPWPLPDGRILYTRWEYVDRSQVDYHHLWTMNPDGTSQMVYFGNLHPPGLYIDAKPIPGTDEVLLINSPGHGAKEHAGYVAIVNIRQGPDHLPSLQNISKNGFRDPYPVNEDMFLAAQGRKLVVMNRDGVVEEIYKLNVGSRGEELHEPRPILRCEREPVIPSHTDYTKTTGYLALADAHIGRNMAGVEKGDIAKLLVVESLPKPINYTGGMDPLSYGGTFTLERVLGEVPVEPDGSAYMEVPANRALFFVALDKNNESVKRMQSFLTVMPGETLSCVGCHEERTQTPLNTAATNTPLALLRKPSEIEKIPDIPDVFDFPRDIQPILDRHCVGCHDYETHDGYEYGPRAGGVILTGDRGPMFSQSYASLTVYGQVADGRNRAVSNYPPRALGAVASPLMHKIHEHHHGVNLSEQEVAYIRYWIETGAAYPGTYGALGAGCIGGYQRNEQFETDYEWQETIAAKTAIQERCFGCHQGDMQIPVALSDENGLSFWQPQWDDPRLKRARHLAFNLSRPELSLMLLAPLAKEAGGYDLCRTGTETPSVFLNKDDPAYEAILAMCIAGEKRLGEIKRFDMEGYQPPAPYIREMARYGVLKDYNGTSPVDMYALDKAYWVSFNLDVVLEHPAYTEQSP